MDNASERMFLNVAEIQERYLPFSKKKIRAFIKKHVPYRIIGNSICVEKEALEAVLKSKESNVYPT